MYSIAERLPARVDAVQEGKENALARRADVRLGAPHNHAGFCAQARQRTGAAATVVRGFDIKCNECGRRSGYGGRRARALWMRTTCRTSQPGLTC